MLRKKYVLIMVGLILLVGFVILRKDMIMIPNEVSVINRAQAAKMLSLSVYTSSECAGLKEQAAFTDVDAMGWYAKYVNAVVSKGLMQYDDELFKPMDPVTYEDALYILQKMSIDETRLSFEINERILNDAITKEKWYEVYDLMIENNEGIQKKEIIVIGTPSNMESTKAWHCATDAGLLGFEGLSMDRYIDSKIKVYLKDDEILNVIDMLDEEILLENVWILKGEGNKLKAYLFGYYRWFSMDKALSMEVESVMGDILLDHQSIKQVNIKKNVIKGEILSTGDDYIEIKGYGKVSTKEPFNIYKLFDGVLEITTDKLEVGNKYTEFILDGEYICGAVIRAPKEVETIRVLLSTDHYSGYEHQEVTITSDVDFYARYGDDTVNYEAGAKVSINSATAELQSNELIFETTATSGKLQILSLNRNQGHPKYRGSLKLKKSGDSVIMINELLLEEYLYGVLPSEMPVTYGLEALKVQAVCARSFAVEAMKEHKFDEYEAHVDDSVLSQVYNNGGEDALSNQAVDDTYAQVVAYGEEIVKTYFFSTSSGSTADAVDVWVSTESSISEYLKGKQQVINGAEIDLSNEESFIEFIDNYENEVYFEKDIGWFRWEVKLDKNAIKTSFEKVIASRCSASPEHIQVKNSEGNFVSDAVTTVGDVASIEISNRGASGVAKELVITGSDLTVKVIGEYNIRAVLAPLSNILYCVDGSTKTNLEMLPSGFFYITANEDESYTLKGGGYGHGVGMSQNGVKKLAEKGYKYSEILQFYYSGTEIKNVY